MRLGVSRDTWAAAIGRGLVGPTGSWQAPATLAGQLAAIVAAAGSVTGAAAAIGVPRRTMRNWLAGTRPRGGERLGAIAAAATRAARRNALDRQREQRIRNRTLRASVKARVVIDTPGKPNPKTRLRTMHVGQYIQADKINRLVDEWLDGGDGVQVFKDAIATDYDANIVLTELHWIKFE